VLIVKDGLSNTSVFLPLRNVPVEQLDQVIAAAEACGATAILKEPALLETDKGSRPQRRVVS
jgi:hypothetical protein